MSTHSFLTVGNRERFIHVQWHQHVSCQLTEPVAVSIYSAPCAFHSDLASTWLRLLSMHLVHHGVNGGFGRSISITNAQARNATY